MQIKTSVRYYNTKAVRAVWDNNHSCWLYSATDIISILTDAKNPRKYWNDIKSRKPLIKHYVYVFKILASDNKRYASDMISDEGINVLLTLLPTHHNKSLSLWLAGLSTPEDQQSKIRAYSLWNSDILDTLKPGTTKCLIQIHSYLFGGIYKFAGQIRTRNIAKGTTTFANANYLDTILSKIDNMPQSNLKEIVDKYIEMNIAHPFMEGNGRAMRIWLDLILKKELDLCVDWSKISKEDYFAAMIASIYNPKPLLSILTSALTKEVNNRQIYMKGIDTSYYYEEVE